MEFLITLFVLLSIFLLNIETPFQDMFIPILGFIFAFTIIITLYNYMLRTFFFIKPMSERYKIMLNNQDDLIKYRRNLIFLSISIICFLLFLLYRTMIFMFIVMCIFIPFYGFLKCKQYKRYNIFNYINEFSEDLYDWYKIYELDLPEETKRVCFDIHYKNYDNFKEEYLRHLKVQKILLDLENKKINNLIDKTINDKK